jgi:hypothetical protein
VRAINKEVFIGDLNNRGAAEFVGRIIESRDSFTPGGGAGGRGGRGGGGLGLGLGG